MGVGKSTGKKAKGPSNRGGAPSTGAVPQRKMSEHAAAVPRAPAPAGAPETSREGVEASQNRQSGEPSTSASHVTRVASDRSQSRRLASLPRIVSGAEIDSVELLDEDLSSMGGAQLRASTVQLSIASACGSSTDLRFHAHPSPQGQARLRVGARTAPPARPLHRCASP